ncbi:unnamed protein product [Chrysoparadoxa australica]
MAEQSYEEEASQFDQQDETSRTEEERAQEVERRVTLRDIGGEAVWSLTTAKPGNGVEQIRDGKCETYWQSDGAQPHQINIQFHRKVTIAEVAFYLDYKLDESYTPKKLSIRVGSTSHDLAEIKAIELTQPIGWVRCPLVSPIDATSPIRAHALQICIISMHQNGRDTHMRQCMVFGPRHEQQAVAHGRSLPKFTTVEFSQFSTVR